MSSAVAQPLQPPATSSDLFIPDHAAAAAAATQHYSPDLTAPSPASSRRQQAYSGDGAPPNTPSSAAPHSPNTSSTATAVSTPRAQPQQQQSPARQTPTSRSSAAAAVPSQGAHRSARPDVESTSLTYRSSQQKQAKQENSPGSDRQDSTRTSVPFNTPELAPGFDPDRSRENAGSTPGAATNSSKREKSDHRIVREPLAAHHRQVGSTLSRQIAPSRSTGALGNAADSFDQRVPSGRRDSTVIHRLVVTDPQVDIEREQARLAEAQPASSPRQPQRVESEHSTSGLGLVGRGGVEDGGSSAQQYQQQQHHHQQNHHHHRDVQQQHQEQQQPQPQPQQHPSPQQEQQQPQRSRQEHLRNSQPKREIRFGEYFLGQTVGEGEFGKVKLGWKGNGSVQVAIKLIRRESLGNNPNRLPKIYREIAILRGLQHPNIVRLHEMVETERHIGIILEYASGGELFDYILNHRYLKDHHARRLFAQLVSGVGYLHKKGIVHRDLKLENLLLDRNKNIIITDFGFANTFNTDDELGEEIENNLSNKDFVQCMGLEQVRADGHRRGDLMQTSCGSPCYAAPELVVSDTLYTGRKVDVWSCGVILYAMLAGYLPFDDDPSNPEGDNINLLYKYIVSTPLTFPEYVTPHARDLLRRILVPDPRKRADLFEVARHSWLSEYSHVVGFITSTSTSAADLHQAAASDVVETKMPVVGLGRSSSTRETTRPSPKVGNAAGRSPALPSTEDRQKKERDAKRRTVQLEYVAPQMSTQRGEVSPAIASFAQPSNPRATISTATTAAPVPISSPKEQGDRPATMSSVMPPPVRNTVPRAVSESTAAIISAQSAVPLANRPHTRGSMAANNGSRLPSRGNSYGQPSIATVAPTMAEGRFAQPQRNSMILSGPTAGTETSGSDTGAGRPVSQQFPAGHAPHLTAEARLRRKRTNTMESLTAKIFGRSNSVRKQSQADGSSPRPDRKSRQYPPVSLNQSMAPSTEANQSGSRRSTESRRSSVGFGRNSSMGGHEGETSKKDKRASKRFSFIPQVLSRMSLSGAGGKDESSKESKRQSMAASTPRSRHDSTMFSGILPPPSATAASGAQEQGTFSSTDLGSDTTAHAVNEEPSHRHQRLPPHHGPQRGATAPERTLVAPHSNPSGATQQQPQPHFSPSQSAETQATEISTGLHPNFNTSSYPLQQGSGPRKDISGDGSSRARSSSRTPNTLQKPYRKLGGEESGVGGSSSGARRVMNWFRSRGKERGA